MEIFVDQHHIPTVTTPTSYITNNNNTYTTGNLTFFPRPTLTRNDVSNIDRYFYKYDYGDNTTGEQYLEFNSTHLYKRPGNYSYMVQGYAINSKDSNIAYHASYNGTLVILGEDYTLNHVYIYMKVCRTVINKSVSYVFESYQGSLVFG